MRIAAWVLCITLTLGVLDARKLTQAERMSKAEEASMKSRQTWLNLYKSPAAAPAAPPADSEKTAAAAPAAPAAAPAAPADPGAAAAPPDADESSDDDADADVTETESAAITPPKPQKSSKELKQEAASYGNNKGNRTHEYV